MVFDFKAYIMAYMYMQLSLYLYVDFLLATGDLVETIELQTDLKLGELLWSAVHELAMESYFRLLFLCKMLVDMEDWYLK